MPYKRIMFFLSLICQEKMNFLKFRAALQAGQHKNNDCRFLDIRHAGLLEYEMEEAVRPEQCREEL